MLWALDPEQGAIVLLFFVFPFAALLAVVARAPYAAWLPRALATSLVGLAAMFAAIGLYQAWTHTLVFAQDLRVANAYTTYFRVTSLFKDPSIYGRQLVLALALLVALLWLGRTRPLVAARAGRRDLRRAVLLVFAIEPRRAVRHRARGEPRARRPPEPQRRHRDRGGDGDRRRRDGRDRGVGARHRPRDKRPDAAGLCDRARHRQPPGSRRRHRQPAARGQGGARHAAPRVEERVPYDPAHGARRARRRSASSSTSRSSPAPCGCCGRRSGETACSGSGSASASSSSSSTRSSTRASSRTR